MKEITTSKDVELTPEQIALMSEVMAEYMGKNTELWHKKYNSEPILLVQKSNKHFEVCCYHSSWDWLHKVWGKVKKDERFKNTILYDPIVSLMVWGTEEQVFCELYNIINQLKQEQNGNKSI